MIFSAIPSGESLFVDANTFIYHFEPHPVFGPPCSQLVTRVEQRDLYGFTSTHVVSEVAHRLMILEAGLVFGWPAGKILQRLRRNPSHFQQLARFRQAVEEVFKLPIQILTIQPALIANASVISQQFGLLTNDALIVPLVQANGITNLASHDADFDRVPGPTRYAPA